MFIEYNAVRMPILSMESWIKEQVYDEVNMNYVGERNNLVCTTFVNPANIFFPTGRVTNNNQQEMQPQFTHMSQVFVELVNRLREPRKTLRVFVCDDPNNPTTENDLLKSPLDGCITDMRTGPIVHTCQIIPVGGQTTFCLRFGVETIVPAYDGKDASVVISNIWSYTSSYDEHYYQTRIIEGTAMLRKDLMLRNKTTYNSLRKSLFFPIPLGYRRTRPTVSIDGSGTVLSYHFEDVELKRNIPGAVQFGITNIQVIEQRGYSAPATTSKLLGKAGAVIFG